MKIAVFGLGLIGSAWAENLAQDGFEVARWNRSPKSVPGFTSDARGAADGAALLFIVVSDPAAVQSVLDAIFPVLKPGQIVIQSSTISPDFAKKFAAQVEALGAAFLDAPFTGSKPAAEQRKTLFFIGGDSTVLDRARPVLQRLSSGIEFLGPVGSASGFKLAININIALVTQALCESLEFARAAGISDDKYFELLRKTSSHTKLADLKEPKLKQRDFSPQFALKHMAKDLRLASAAANSLKLPQMRALSELYEQALKLGWGEDDFIALARFAGQSIQK